MGTLYSLSPELGNFSILAGDQELIIIVPNLPFESKNGTEQLRKIIVELAKGKTISGVVFLSFGEENGNLEGLSFLLKTFNPFWIIYPKCNRREKVVERFFKAVSEAEYKKNQVFKRIPVSANKLSIYPSLARISRGFSFLPFSPFLSEKDNKAEGELVLKITENTTERAILIASDVSKKRFQEIGEKFMKKLKSDILLVFPHFLSEGIPEKIFDLISPEIVLICLCSKAKPDLEAMRIYEKAFWFSTSLGNSFATIFDSKEIKTIRTKNL